jgi:hypothetical protein
METQFSPEPFATNLFGLNEPRHHHIAQALPFQQRKPAVLAKPAGGTHHAHFEPFGKMISVEERLTRIEREFGELKHGPK